MDERSVMQLSGLFRGHSSFGWKRIKFLSGSTKFSLADGEWRIPAKKMKMRRPHRVPLASQALAILRELQEITGGSRYLFPSVKSWHRPISDNSLNAALRVSDTTRSI